MQRLMGRAICSIYLFGAAFSFLEAASFEDCKKAQMIQDLEIIKHHFEFGYAPSEWKKEYTGWDLNDAFEQSKAHILSMPSITTKQFQQIVRDYLKTMNDYHVDAMFYSTEAASLPFSVRGVDGRYFIDWIDPVRLPISMFGIRQGDELLQFDNQTISNVMSELAKVSGKSSHLNTDLALADMKLTLRLGVDGDAVPKGPIEITTISAKTGKMRTHQLRWFYTPEYVRNPFDFIQPLNFISYFTKANQKKTKLEFTKMIMANPLHLAIAEKHADRSGGFGTRKSFLPNLGEVIWSNENPSTENEDLPFWHAYIYRHPQGHKIGYVRIPHYYLTHDLEAEVKEFGKLIEMFEKETDALIIDQLHNFGGYVHIQYGLASMLTNYPLQAPYHRIKISQQDVYEAHQKLETIKLIEIIAENGNHQSSQSGSDQNQDGGENQNKDKEDDGFYFEGERINFQEMLFSKAYYEHILEEWGQGRTLTRPIFISGVDKINPHPKYQYTKPILMLIDELDFSGGDFVPAIFQDNQRAVLFGSRTAGAGGYVSKFKFPNKHGIAQCSYTGSIAERTDLNKIENLGVSPDIPYQITIEDVQCGYRGYIEAVNEAVDSLMQNR